MRPTKRQESRGMRKIGLPVSADKAMSKDYMATSTGWAETTLAGGPATARDWVLTITRRSQGLHSHLEPPEGNAALLMPGLGPCGTNRRNWPSPLTSAISQGMLGTTGSWKILCYLCNLPHIHFFIHIQRKEEKAAAALAQEEKRRIKRRKRKRQKNS